MLTYSCDSPRPRGKRGHRAHATVAKALCLGLVLWLTGSSAALARHTSVTALPPVSARMSTGPLLPVTLSPLEERLFADAADGRLDEHTLLTAALVAGGATDPAAIERYQRHVDVLVAHLRQSAAVAGSPRQRAAAVFEFMHARILRGGYQIDATVLSTVLDEGRFNCVSASVLFCYLAGQFGLDARGLELPGHAMSRLHFGSDTLDIETTCPRWFRLTGDLRRQAELAAKAAGTGLSAASPDAKCREVSGVALVATIYYNRGVDLLREKRFAEAAQANAKALWLDPTSATARGNLLATLNNWAIDEGTSGRYNEAAGLLRSGLALQSDFRPFHVNFIHVHRQWSQQLCRQGRFEESCAVLRSAQQDLAGEPWFAQTIADIRRRQAAALPVGKPVDAAPAGLPWTHEHFVSDNAPEAAAQAAGRGTSL